MPSDLQKGPRISANDLALYMESTDTARMGIIRRAKHPKKPPMIRYRDARRPICAYLADGNRRLQVLVAAEDMLKQRAGDPKESSLRQDDARQSIEVLHALQRMRNRLAEYDFQPVQGSQKGLVIGGVDVSVRADLLVHGSTRNRDLFGLALLRMTQDDADSEPANTKRRNMGLWVAILARMHAEKNFDTNREVASRLCMSIDVQHGDIFVAPDAITRRANDLENACRFIAAIWPTV